MIDNYPTQKYTLAQVRKLRSAVIYGLCDDAGIFYIGQTKVPNLRFNPKSHHFLRSDLVMSRIKLAGASFYVRILEKIASPYTQEMLDEAERQAIELNCLTLVNRQYNPIKWGLRDGPVMQLCARCALPITVNNSNYCYDCLGSLLNKRGSSKQELRDMLQKLRA